VAPLKEDAHPANSEYRSTGGGQAAHKNHAGVGSEGGWGLAAQ
jgi:hypothetical protein